MPEVEMPEPGDVMWVEIDGKAWLKEVESVTSADGVEWEIELKEWPNG